MSVEESDCDWKDLGDLDKRMTRLMSRFLVEAGGHQFHGAVILAPVCPKCGALHDFRMQTDIASKPDGDFEAQREAVVGMLEDLLAKMRDERTRPVVVNMRSSYDA